MTRATRRLASIAALAGAIWLLRRAGTGPLATPPLRAGDIGRWLDERDAATVAVATLRLVGLGLAWYLLGATLLAAAVGDRVDAITLPAMRRLVHAMAGLGLTAGAATLTLGPDPDQAARPSAAAVMRQVPGAGLEWMHAVEDPGTDGSATLRLLPVDVPAVGGTTWVLEPGDHLWAVAETHLADALGRTVSDAEVTPYWAALVELNRGVLLDPENADLVYPGQTIALPPLPSA